MSFRKKINRELEVAFSKHAQPVWFRILKYTIIGGILYFFWGTPLLGIIFAVIFIGGISLHFWYRYKTNAWTKSYGAWDYEKNKSNIKED